jgi:hypothetical protein
LNVERSFQTFVGGLGAGVDLPDDSERAAWPELEIAHPAFHLEPREPPGHSFFTLPFAPEDRRPSPIHGGPAEGETNEALAEFMERVALSHVVGLGAPPAATSQATIVGASETTTASAVPFPPPRPAAMPQHRPISSKVHVTAGVPKVLPSVPPPQAMTEPAAVSAPVKAGQPQYGMRLLSHFEDILSASTRVVESVASVGDKLTSLAKNL